MIVVDEQEHDEKTDEPLARESEFCHHIACQRVDDDVTDDDRRRISQAVQRVFPDVVLSEDTQVVIKEGTQIGDIGKKRRKRAKVVCILHLRLGTRDDHPQKRKDEKYGENNATHVCDRAHRDLFCSAGNVNFEHVLHISLPLSADISVRR